MPITSAAPAAVAATVTASVALAVVKSIQTSAAPLGRQRRLDGDAGRLDPRARAGVRADRRGAGALARPPSARASGAAALTARVSARPIRPSAPRTAMRIGLRHR